MDEGIVRKEEEAIADFLVTSGYEPATVHPVVCIPTGPRIYNLAVPASPKNYIGLHIMDANDCLEHPDWRPRVQVIKKRFTSDFEEVPPGEAGGDILLDSFEMWKFITLYTKGSAIAYELLYMPMVHCDPNAEYLFSIMREGITNRIGKSARDFALHVWRKDRTNRKKTVIAYYRLMQAVAFLREEEFYWDIGNLLEYLDDLGGTVLIATSIIENFRNPKFRNKKIDQPLQTLIAEEIGKLIDEVDRAGIGTRLPDQVPAPILTAILSKIKQTRLRMI